MISLKGRVRKTETEVLPALALPPEAAVARAGCSEARHRLLATLCCPRRVVKELCQESHTRTQARATSRGLARLPQHQPPNRKWKIAACGNACIVPTTTLKGNTSALWQRNGRSPKQTLALFYMLYMNIHSICN